MEGVVHRSSEVVKAELHEAMQKFVNQFNMDNGTNLTVEELLQMETQHDVHHVLWILTTHGAEYRYHMDDKPGDLTKQLSLGGWTHQKELSE